MFEMPLPVRIALTLFIFLGVSYVILAYRKKQRVLEYLMLVRFPIVLAVTLVALPILSVTAARSLLENLFVLSPREFGFVTFLSIKTAWVVLMCAAIVVINADARFGVGEPSGIFAWGGWLGRWRFVLFGLLALPTIVVAWIYSPNPNPAEYSWWTLQKALGVAAGIAVVTIFFYMVSALRLLILPPNADHFVGLPRLGSIPWIGPRLEHRLRHSEQMQFGNDFIVSRLLLRYVSRLGDGYTRGKQLAPGHGEAVCFAVLALAVYALGLVLLAPGPDRNPIAAWFYNWFSQPALGYVLVLLLLLGLIVSSAAFFFDRFRFPTLAAFAIVSFALYGLTDLDHYYEVTLDRPTKGSAALSPSTPVVNWKKPDGSPADVVIVTASGGGITAAYWTTRVLEGLQKSVPNFAESIRMISSVSGGSVGAMYYVDGYTKDGPPNRPEDHRIAAGSPSLAHTTWGLVYPDFLRGLNLPVTDDRIDRGWATEQAWRGHLSSPTLHIGDWREGIEQGWRPAVIFNATIAENGERFLISPLDLPSRRGTVSFRTMFPGGDLPVTTAARLSATFPYVTPIARATSGPQAKRDSTSFHVADGGYYDNFGVVSAIEWLEDVLPVYKASSGFKVLVVQIRASNYDPHIEHSDRRLSLPRGWLYATLGPLTTLGKVRTSTQTVRNDMEIALLRDHWCYRGIELRTVVFSPEKDGPLSWQLTRAERETIEESWIKDGKLNERVAHNIADIIDFQKLQPATGEDEAARARRCTAQAERSRAGLAGVDHAH